MILSVVMTSVTECKVEAGFRIEQRDESQGDLMRLAIEQVENMAGALSASPSDFIVTLRWEAKES